MRRPSHDLSFLYGPVSCAIATKWSLMHTAEVDDDLIIHRFDPAELNLRPSRHRRCGSALCFTLWFFSVGTSSTYEEGEKMVVRPRSRVAGAQLSATVAEQCSCRQEVTGL